MATTKAQQKAVAKYMKVNYDEFKVRVPKGRKEAIQGAAEAAGQSLNGYVVGAVEARMEREGATQEGEA